jgi:predicted nucleic acid-binding protein
MTVTIDASVWVAARFAGEPGHAASAGCLLRALAGPEPVVLPWLAAVECVAAVARKSGSAALAHEAGQQLRALVPVVWVVLDETVAADAAHIAAACRVRAADAVYVAVARRSGATLVTLDGEVRQRCAAMVRCLPPEECSPRDRV